MLKSISIINSSGISEKVEISFKKSNYDYRTEFFYEDVINPAVFYGTNGSGKTSVLKTIFNLSKIMNADLSEKNTYAMNNIIFEGDETEIKIECLLEDKNFIYYVRISDADQILDETLKINDKKYLRDNYFIDHKNTSFIRSLGRENIDDDVTLFYSYLKEFHFVSVEKNVSGNSLKAKNFSDILEQNSDKFQEVFDFFPEIKPLTFEKVGFNSVVAYYTFNNCKYKFDYKNMLSAGTRDFYEMLGVIFEMRPGSLLIIDEIEKTFHPDLLLKLVKYVVQNYKIQIIASSHNTNFMKHLRPDQIYFTKYFDEVCKIDRLSSKFPGIREMHNIEKLYMGGKFE